MKSMFAAACAVAAVGAHCSAAAQVPNVATPRMGTEAAGPPAPETAYEPLASVRTGPLPPSLSLADALSEGLARSQAIIAAEADVRAARGRLRQAGYRANPELSLEVENVLGTGELAGLRAMETTLSVNQRLDLAGRRGARVRFAQAELIVQQLRLAIVQADLQFTVREQFARAVAAREKLAQASDTVARARELSRVAGVLVEVGRDPPLRAIRARSALAQAVADEEAARAEDLAARSLLAAALGSSRAIAFVEGDMSLPPPSVVGSPLELRLADAERASAEASLAIELTANRLDPAVGLGVRHIRETGDIGLVGGVSIPLPVFDRNRGGISAARAALEGAEARRAGAEIAADARARNARGAVDANLRRVEALEQSAIPEAAEALRLAELSYREGRATLLELLDTQESYTAARAALTDARLALALAQAELARAVATGDTES
ncbi:TolC family protein [Tsuneonella rigui]|uniref:TolC family protein n=2 Tax=Tsuneonella TaxID=2800686 RepID=UPI000F7E6F75|nr:TolC family protein [Tsuneonella rigui]